MACVTGSVILFSVRSKRHETQNRHLMWISEVNDCICYVVVRLKDGELRTMPFLLKFAENALPLFTDDPRDVEATMEWCARIIVHVWSICVYSFFVIVIWQARRDVYGSRFCGYNGALDNYRGPTCSWQRPTAAVLCVATCIRSCM